MIDFDCQQNYKFVLLDFGGAARARQLPFECLNHPHRLAACEGSINTPRFHYARGF